MVNVDIDILPNAYSNWLEFYVCIVHNFKVRGILINDNQIVKISEEIRSTEESEQLVYTVDIKTIKSKAFDYIINKLPHMQQVQHLEHVLNHVHYMPTNDHKILIDNLKDISIR